MSEDLLLPEKKIFQVVYHCVSPQIYSISEVKVGRVCGLLVGRETAKAQLAHCKPLIDAEWQKKLEEAVKQERERIISRAIASGLACPEDDNCPLCEKFYDAVKGATDG